MFSNQSQPSGSVVAPAPVQPFGPGNPGTASVQPGQANSVALPPKKSVMPIILGVLLALVAIIAGVLGWLLIQTQAELTASRTDVDGQIDVAVAMAVSENTTDLENQFAEREKYPYRTFAGPADSGSLTFEYPKTWSVYIEKDGRTSGSEFSAVLNPIEVYASSPIYALRVKIQTADFDNVVSSYDKKVRDNDLQLEVRNIGSASANIYTGKITDDYQGIVTVFKIRDKVVTLQTDAEIFFAEYYKMLETITFAE